MISAANLDRLWNAFERVDHIAARIAVSKGHYLRGVDRNELWSAVMEYRRVRDELDNLPDAARETP